MGIGDSEINLQGQIPSKANRQYKEVLKDTNTNQIEQILVAVAELPESERDILGQELFNRYRSHAIKYCLLSCSLAEMMSFMSESADVNVSEVLEVLAVHWDKRLPPPG